MVPTVTADRKGQSTTQDPAAIVAATTLQDEIYNRLSKILRRPIDIEIVRAVITLKGANRWCSASAGDIADWTGYHKRTVEKRLRVLVDRCFLTDQKSDHPAFPASQGVQTRLLDADWP